ncbi:DHS-like NAD/FAD-binding domain-containing protein [Gilbertella persicaria]|uniref:DHS-like NAD/FAD-binding domain-containing protein n=1 Tax=Gilbertella persicaria TaxID=101096 RepID=UPI00221F71AB|nr:DHS-like NAD/FAD-binding domain-containing protein [Gilbertella persicaria]KAI8094900.1 DHS-like NAD/FAD-binding domain-containing protein [Gilbertella persicaria]
MKAKITISEQTEATDTLLYELARHISSSKRVLVITGAGISCSSGIPDFRSSNGLYDLIKKKYPNTVLRGQDLFNAHLFRDQHQTKCFYTFMAELKSVVSAAEPTPTHLFIRTLQENGQLMRYYTQNIDCLEDALKLSVVRLHGTINRVKCTLCTASFDFTSDYQESFRNGLPPSCPQCVLFDHERSKRGKRSLSTGILRPNIVLYNEAHPEGDMIGKLQRMDLKRKPDLMIIMGTSLKIPALRKFIKEAAKLIHHSSKKGKVVFINKTAPTKEWDAVFDYEILGDTDDWVNLTQDKLNCIRECRHKPHFLDNAKVVIKKRFKKGSHSRDLK